MKLSLVLIVYRSDSSIAQEASKFCEEVLKAKNIKSKRIPSNFHRDEIAKHLYDLELSPNIGIVLGGDGTCLLYTSPSPRDLSTSRMPSSA